MEKKEKKGWGYTESIKAPKVNKLTFSTMPLKISWIYRGQEEVKIFSQEITEKYPGKIGLCQCPGKQLLKYIKFIFHIYIYIYI